MDRATPIRRREWLIALAVISGVTLVFYHRVFLFGELLYGRDLLAFRIPIRGVVNQAYASGQLPVWNPYMFGGVPLAGDVTVWPFYPPALLLAPFGVAAGETYICVLHHMWAALGMYALGRRLGMVPVAAMAAGLSLAFAGMPLSLDDNAMYLLGFSWTPWVLLAVDRLRDRQTVGAIACLSAVMAMQILAGDPQWVTVTGIIAGCYLLTFVERKRLLKALGAMAAASLLALLLAGIQLAPTVSLLRQSVRAGGLSEAMVYSWSLNPLRLMELAAAYPFGDLVGGTTFWGGGLVRHETGVPFVYSPYLGPFVIALALLGLRKGKGRVLWGVLVLVGCVLALGDNTPLYGLLVDYLPLWKSYRYPQKMLAISTFALAILAGWGVDRLVSPREGDNLAAIRWILVALFAVPTLVWLGHTIFPAALISWATELAARDRFTDLTGEAATQVFVSSIRGVALRFGVVVGLIALWSLSSKRHRLAFAFCVIAVADLALVNGPLLRTTDSDLFSASHPIAEAIAQHYDDEVPARIYRDGSVIAPDFGLDGPEAYEAKRWWDQLSLLANVGVEYHLSHVRANGVTPSPEAEALWTALVDDGVRAIRLTGVSYIIAAPDNPAFHDDDLFRQVLLRPQANFVVYEYLEAVPPIRLIYSAERTDPDDALQRLLSPDFDVRSSLLIGEGGEELVDQRAVETLWDEANVTEYGLAEMRIEVEASEEAYLFVADTYDPDWVATLDGEEVPILVANLTMRAVRIPPGSHVVEMKMQSKSLRTGIALSVSGLVLIVIMLGVGVVRRRLQEA